MAGGKQTPRQAMIGMMYLVLLAMLAMNASKDLLNAFVMLEQGIDKTVTGFAKANEEFYMKIEKAAATSPSYKKTLDQALEIQKKANEVCQLIADDKIKLVSGLILQSTADTVNGALKEFLDDSGIPLNKDNQDLGAQYYVPGGAPSEAGLAIKTKVDEFRDLVIKVLDSDGDESNDYLVERYKKLFDTEDKPDPHDPSVVASFASTLSEHLPLASVTANLSLYQSYVRNAEADVVGSIAAKMDGDGMVVDKGVGLVQYESGYVLKGDTVKGEIFLAAYNSKSTPHVYLGIPDTALFKKNGGVIKYAPGAKAKVPILNNASPKPLPSRNGKGVYAVPANEVGSQALNGVIEVVTAKGTFFYPYKSHYMVAEPSATVAATKMNVFYIGVPNPISVSAPGVALEDIEVTGGGLSISKGKKPGEYIVKASRPTKKGQEIEVAVKKKGGGKLGGMKFRVKRLPDPAASILGKKEGLVSKGELRAASFLKAEMENFDFDVKVRVKSFSMSVNIGGDLVEKTANSQMLTGEMKGLLSKVRKGNKIYFENIKVIMPDGKARSIPSVALKVR